MSPISDTTVVTARDLRQVYAISNGFMRKSDALQAVSGVSFSIQAGKTLAIVGESGCGKSTLARMVSLIESPTSGDLQIGTVNAVTASQSDKRVLRQQVQLVFQNPYGSLNPRKRIGQPEDLDGLLLLLAADESRFINGAIMTADDGMSAQ